MTQKDISDLRPSEVDLNRGTITRKRSKTIRLKSTPTVTFKLWQETIALMKRNRSKNKEHYFTNNLGNPLKSESVGEGNKFSKTDIIGKDSRTLRDALNIDKDLSFINLKKTSRSLLEDNKQYQPIAELFVGRRPRSISDRHYAKPPESWLAEATDWLREVLEIEKVLK